MSARPGSPEVTVMMPTYNSVRYVDAAVLSIIGSTLTSWELLAYDDRSDDGTLERLQFWAEQDERIVVAQPFADHGSYGEICNQMIADARGAYCARMDSDDVSMPTRLEREVDFLASRPGAILVGGMAHAIMEEEGGVLNTRYPWLAGLVAPVASETTPVNDALRTFNRMVHATIMARRQDLVDAGGYDTGLFPLEDWALALELAESGDVYVLPDILALKRQHAHNGSKRHPNLKPAFAIIRDRYGLPLTELPKVSQMKLDIPDEA